MPFSPFPYSDTNKRYHTWDYFIKHRYGGKVLKIPLNAGFGCPNLDGTRGRGGCTFCSAAGSGDFAGDPEKSLTEQFMEQRQKLAVKWPQAEKYIGYFQAYTNTYAPLEVLRRAYEEVLEQPGVVGLSIATRPDVLPEEAMTYLSALNRQTEFVLEAECYKRPKGPAPSPPLEPWYQAKSFTICHEEKLTEDLFSRAIVDRLKRGYEFLLPYYDYFVTLDGEPDPRERPDT